MARLITFSLAVLLLLPVLFVDGSASPKAPRKFDEFGDLNCEDEMARMDNFAIQLQHSPADTGYIIFYGGRRFRGRLPRRGEGAARAARLKTYLVERRGLPSRRVIVVDGGYMEEWRAELWFNPPGMSPPQPDRSLTIEKIKFRKGKAHARDFRCQT